MPTLNEFDRLRRPVRSTVLKPTPPAPAPPPTPKPEPAPPNNFAGQSAKVQAEVVALLDRIRACVCGSPPNDNDAVNWMRLVDLESVRDRLKWIASTLSM
jgi:hypothetical protein